MYNLAEPPSLGHTPATCAGRRVHPQAGQRQLVTFSPSSQSLLSYLLSVFTPGKGQEGSLLEWVEIDVYSIIFGSHAGFPGFVCLVGGSIPGLQNARVGLCCADDMRLQYQVSRCSLRTVALPLEPCVCSSSLLCPTLLSQRRQEVYVHLD